MVPRRSESGNRPTCSIIIPVFNNCFFTRLCLQALRACRRSDPAFEIIVIDNGSTDGTRAALDEFANDIARVVTNDSNLGFAIASNQGAGAARGEFLVFLNNDVIVNPGWLNAMVGAMRGEPVIGAVGVRLLYPDGTIQHAGVIFAPGGYPNHAFCGRPGDWPAALRSREYQAVTAACLLVDKRLFESVGGFDVGYLNSFEDIDLCFKIRRAGRQVWYSADSVAHHFESVTPGRNFRDDLNCARFHERWRDEVTIDVSVANAPIAAGGGTAALRRESEALADKVHVLATENGHLRRILTDQLPLIAQAIRMETTLEPADHADVVYRPAQIFPQPADASIVTPILITNTGTKSWSSGDLRLSYHWLLPGGTECAIWDGIRTILGSTFAPGQSILVWASVTAPSVPGRYILEWDGVEEGVAWLSQLGVVPYRQTVDVVEVPVGAVVIEHLPTLIQARDTFEIGVRLQTDQTRKNGYLLGWSWSPISPPHDPCAITRVPSSSLPVDAAGNEVAVRVAVLGPQRGGRYRLQFYQSGPEDSWIPLSTMGGELQVISPEEVSSVIQDGPAATPAGARSDDGKARCPAARANEMWTVEDTVYFRARFRRVLDLQRDKAKELQAHLDRERQETAVLRSHLARAQRHSAELDRLVEGYRSGRLMRGLSYLHDLRRRVSRACLSDFRAASTESRSK